MVTFLSSLEPIKAPSWVEVSVALGILAVGMLVVTALIKPALIIEQRFEARSGIVKL